MNTDLIRKDVKTLCAEFGARLLLEEPLAPYTSFKIGGKGDIVKVNSAKLLSILLNYCAENSVPKYVLGRGSNVLISDNGLKGLVLLIGEDFSEIIVENEYISCQAGAKLSEICKLALENSLTGLEFAYGIPGTAGGALCMNAGAYGGEIKDIVRRCSYLNETGEKKRASVSEMELSYRKSIFSANDWVITHVLFDLNKADKAGIKAKMDEISAARKEKQPLDFPSAGSVFKRPDGYFAAKLIDECGLKGRSVGNAQVSEKHCGFIVNKGGATFAEVKELIEIVQSEVKAKTGVVLEREVKIWE